MSKMSKAVADIRKNEELRVDKIVTNFMGGDSYVINPLDTLKMITASSIFGEPSYYRSSKRRLRYCVDKLIKDYSVIPEEYIGKTTEQIMEAAIDAALDYDFDATLEWAKSLRHDFMMRLNPQVIMVRAAIHPKRTEFTQRRPGVFNAINRDVMSRADEALSQMSYYLYNNDGKKNNIPSIIKRSWADNLSSLNRYQIAKYKNHEIGMINGVRLCHASSEVINELMTKGTVNVEDSESTWENLRSSGMSWKDIYNTAKLGHMALLRNLRGVFTEIDDIEFCKEYLDKLKSGVEDGKQFPFRYYSAIKAVNGSDCNHKSLIINALEECMDIALKNYPKLKGKTMCLSDNSGSAWSCFNSEYGYTTIAEIDNLSSVITAACSDDGYVGKFGDKLDVQSISKRLGVLSQAKQISSDHGASVGQATEGGIWVFFRNAIRTKEHWDNIFIYSDMQAGHGGLYGTQEQQNEYYSTGYNVDFHINVFKLICEYRKKVNPKVNVFCIQTAGYNNVVIPEYTYRTNIMYGWTGKEAVFADAMISQWDEMDKRNKENIAD